MRRRNYTHSEAQTVLTEWLKRKRMTPTQFQAWLAENGVEVTREYCRMLTVGKLTPGPKFKAIFKQITGITLVDGLIEAESTGRRP